MHAIVIYTVLNIDKKQLRYAYYKLLLTYYFNISVQAANLSNCGIESKKIDSIARIESKLFLPELGSYGN